MPGHPRVEVEDVIEWPQTKDWYSGDTVDKWFDHELECRQGVAVCPVCGAYVREHELHKAFHLSL